MVKGTNPKAADLWQYNEVQFGCCDLAFIALRLHRHYRDMLGLCHDVFHGWGCTIITTFKRIKFIHIDVEFANLDFQSWNGEILILRENMQAHQVNELQLLFLRKLSVKKSYFLDNFPLVYCLMLGQPVN